MEAKIVFNGDVLKNVLKVVKAVNNEVIFKVDKGLKIGEYDPSQTTMIYMTFANGEESYFFSEGNSIFYVDVKQLLNCINSMEGPIEIVKDGQSIQVANAKQIFYIKTDVSGEDVENKFEEITRGANSLQQMYGVKYVVNMKELKKILTDIEKIEGHYISKIVEIQANDGMLTFKAHSEEELLMEARIEADGEGKANSHYRLELLRPIKFLAFTDKVSLKFSTDEPLRVWTTIINIGGIDYYIAPTIMER